MRGADRFEARAATPDDAQAIAEVNVAAGRVAWAAFVPRERLERFDRPSTGGGSGWPPPARATPGWSSRTAR